MEAKNLQAAMRGVGTNEKALIKVAASHNFVEREQIAKAYMGCFGEPLEAKLKKELNGKLEALMIPMFEDRYVFWAKEIKEAIAGAGTDEKKLIRLVITMNDDDFKHVSAAYATIFHQDLLRSISNDIGL